MCSIFGSTDKTEFFELATLNGYRGTHSHSVAVLKDDVIVFMRKSFGPLLKCDLPEGDLYIGHQQAPTTDSKDADSIHPATRGNIHLWHNGIIKDHVIQEWQQRYGHSWSWDTKWLLYRLINEGIESLSTADGSFACLYYINGHLMMFRNENCPMFVSNTGFSSSAFNNSVSINHGHVYIFEDGQWTETTQEFVTNTPFFWSPE